MDTLHISCADADRRAALSICKKIGTPRALAVHLCISSGSKDLLEMTMDAGLYSNAIDFGVDYLVTSLLQKWTGHELGIDTAAVATEGWFLSERKCRDTNLFFRQSHTGFTPRFEAVLFMAQRKIANVLGELSPRVFAECKWSNGATSDLRRGSTFCDKMASPISVTQSALPLLRRVIEEDLHWMSHVCEADCEGPVSLLPSAVKIVEGNRFLTVPKSAKTDRCIAAEPTGNMFLQQGVGRYIRGRLKRFGVDLDSQIPNQQLAGVAYKAALATLDLKSASDTISAYVVRHLLPVDWYSLLDALRSRKTIVSDVVVPLEKFSSMGNGFTFELETLIFWALTSSVVELEGYSRFWVAVYGDDIICPSGAAQSVIETLNLCGFEVNGNKSFVNGLFFESCGFHYFNGTNVTPVYQKARSDTPQECIRSYNRLVRWATRLFGSPFHRCILGALDVYLSEFRKVHHDIPRIPLGDQSDDGFLSGSHLLGAYSDNHGYYCRVYTPRPLRVRKERWARGFLAYKLRRPGISSADHKGHGYLHGNGEQHYRFSRSWRHGWEGQSSDWLPTAYGDKHLP